jgi:hypothetical protein
MEIAEKEGAIAFDIPGANLNQCEDLWAFDVIIRDYEWTDKALRRMVKTLMPQTRTIWMPTPWQPASRPSQWVTHGGCFTYLAL